MTLSILTAAAEHGLVLCLVDDAHWLDAATADALVFAARRTEADRVVMVFSARDGAAREFRPEGIPTMALAGLEPSAARGLLGGLTHTDRAAQDVVERLVSETGGNPLALLELPTELSRAQLGGTTPLPPQLPLTSRVERVFLDRCRRLPAGVQSLLLVAAADDTGELVTVRRAASTLGIDAQAHDVAVGSGLIADDGGTVSVRHALVRSAVYQAATAAERRRAHRALAEALAEAQAEAQAGAATRTGGPGIAPRPPRDRTRRWWRSWRASAPEPSDAAGTSPPWPPSMSAPAPEYEYEGRSPRY